MPLPADDLWCVADPFHLACLAGESVVAIICQKVVIEVVSRKHRHVTIFHPWQEHIAPQLKPADVKQQAWRGFGFVQTNVFKHNAPHPPDTKRLFANQTNICGKNFLVSTPQPLLFSPVPTTTTTTRTVRWATTQLELCCLGRGKAFTQNLPIFFPLFFLPLFAHTVGWRESSHWSCCNTASN